MNSYINHLPNNELYNPYKQNDYQLDKQQALLVPIHSMKISLTKNLQWKQE